MDVEFLPFLRHQKKKWQWWFISKFLHRRVPVAAIALLRHNPVRHMMTTPMIFVHMMAFQGGTEAATGQTNHPPERILSSF